MILMLFCQMMDTQGNVIIYEWDFSFLSIDDFKLSADFDQNHLTEKINV